jgi:hypothetical protein
VKDRKLSVLMAWALLLVGCADRTGAVPASPSSQPTTSEGGATFELRGTLVKYTNFPCHRSDPYVGNERIVFRGSDGSRTVTVTGSASWIGLAADPPVASLGRCRQVAPFEVTLPVADRYSVEVNDGILEPISLTRIRAAGFRLRLLLGDHVSGS